MTARKPSGWLTPNVRTLSVVSLLQDSASELLYPVLPLFLTVTLGAPASVVGLVEGVAEGTASVGKAVSGRLADRFRRRPLIAAGYGVSSVAKPLIGLASGWPVVLGARFIDRVGKGLRTSPRDALIAAETPPAMRGRAFGLHRAADTAGAVVGPLLGLALYELLDHRLRPLFFVAAIPAVVSVALIALVREHPPPPGAAPPRGVPLRRLPRPYARVVAFLALFGLANFSDALLILRAHALGLGFVGIVTAYALYNAVYAALSYPAGVVSDRLPRRLVFAVYGAYTALTDGVGRAWVANLLPPGALGTGLGLYQGVAGACALTAGIWAGLAWGGTGRVPLLVSGAIVTVLAATLALGGRRLER